MMKLNADAYLVRDTKPPIYQSTILLTKYSFIFCFQLNLPQNAFHSIIKKIITQKFLKTICIHGLVKINGWFDVTNKIINCFLFQATQNEIQKAYLATNFQRKKEQFDTIFSAEAHETLRKRGLRRFSLKALQVKFSERATKIWCNLPQGLE